MYILVPHMVLYPSSLPTTLSSLRTLWVHLLLAAVQTNVGLSFHSTWMSAVCTRKTEASFLASPFFPPLVLTLIPQSRNAHVHSSDLSKNPMPQSSRLLQPGDNPTLPSHGLVLPVRHPIASPVAISAVVTNFLSCRC